MDIEDPTVTEPGSALLPAAGELPPPGELAAMLDRLAAVDANTAGRLEFMDKLVAYLIGKLGPVQVRASEHVAAEPADLIPMPVNPDDPDMVVVWALPHQITAGGIVTAEARIAAVLREHADADPAAQARAVLIELGLPVREA